MKILGIGVQSDALAGDTWLSLDDVTVVLGANDAGKSTLLNTVHDALALIHRGAPATTRQLSVAVLRLTLELEPEAFEELLARGCQAAAEGGGRTRFTLAGRDVVLDPNEALPGGGRIRNFLYGADEGRDTWLQFVRVQAELTARRWDPLFAALRASSVIELQPTNSRGHGEVDAWSMSWCLPRASQLDAKVTALVRELGISLEPELDAPIAIFPGHPSWIADEGLPEPLWAPRNEGDIPARMLRVTGKLQRAATECAQIATDADFDDVPNLAEAETLAARIVRTVAAMARDQAPPFVSERYGLFARREEGDNGARCLLQATSRRSGRTFPLDHLAQGYRLWVQLAFLDALETAEVAADALLRGLIAEDEPLDGALLEVLHALGPGWDPLHDDGAVAPIQRLALMWPGRRSLVEASVGDSLASPSFSRMHRLYIIDEPEQHLHPTLQRRAARWLRDWTRERQVQCLIATHAPAFLALGDGATFMRVTRTTEELVTVAPIDPYGLSASDEAAVELGLDRGELLSLHSVVLFVEGLTDAAVLEHLFPDRIREIGLLICPLHGVKGVRALPTAQVLFRLLRTPFAVLVDNDPGGQIRELWKESTDELRRLSGRNAVDEVVHVARMLAAAREYNVHVEPFAISGKDVLALLDPRDVNAAVEQSGAAVEEPWPGWPTAQALYLGAGRDKSFETFIAEGFGVVKEPAFFALAADSARRAGRVPQGLTEVLDALERLAL